MFRLWQAMYSLGDLSLERCVTCTCEPPRAAGTPVATMSVPPAVRLRSPSATDGETLLDYWDCRVQTYNPRTDRSHQDL